MSESLAAWGYAAFAVEEAARQEAYAAEQAKKQEHTASKRKVGDETFRCAEVQDIACCRFPNF